MKLQAWFAASLAIVFAALAASVHAQPAEETPLALVERWTLDRTLVERGAGSDGATVSLDAVTLRETGWTPQRMLDAVDGALRLLAACGIAAGRIEVLTYAGGPPAMRDLWTPASRELARRVSPARPAVFFVAGTRHRPAFEAEAFGRGNTATRPELVHTVWITTAARDLPIVLAHELAHVLAGSGEHSALPGNLMREDTTPGATRLTAAQCARIREHGEREGLLVRRAVQRVAGAAARGTTKP
jgi:hypothetical protein